MSFGSRAYASDSAPTGRLSPTNFVRMGPLLRNDRTFPATNFQFVPVRIFEKAGVIAAAVAATDLRAFQTSSADFAHEPGEPINFFTGLSPKSDSCAVGLMTSILREAEKRFRLVFADCIERSPPSARAIAGKTERGQQLAVKLLRALQITYSQVNMVEISCFFHFVFAGFRFAWVATPDDGPLTTDDNDILAFVSWSRCLANWQ
jgi:hypothetical protein